MVDVLVVAVAFAAAFVLFWIPSSLLFRAAERRGWGRIEATAFCWLGALSWAGFGIGYLVLRRGGPE